MADKNLSLGTIFTGHVDDKFRRETKKLTDIVNKLTKGMNTLNKSMLNAGSGASKLGTGLDAAAKKSAAFSSKAAIMNKQLSRIKTGLFDTTVNAFRVTAAYGIAATALYRLISGFQAGVLEIVNFDQALKNLQAITGATDQEISAMGERIKDVATTTKFSTVEVAEGMVLLGQAGLTASESMQAIQATSDLATGTLSNMQLTTDLMTTTLRAFNLQAVESNRVADVMANAINKSKLTIDKLRIAFNFVGAAAAQTGLSIEETSASMMVLANNGLRASTIGTGLRQVLARLLAPNRKLRTAFEMHGIELDKVNPRLVGFGASLMRLAPILYDQEKGVVDMGKAYELFGLRGAQAAAVLIKAFTSGSYEDMLKKVYEFGTAADMAAKQAEGLGVMWKNLADRAKVMFLALGDTGLTGALRTLVEVLRDLTDSVKDLLEDPWGRFAVQTATITASVVVLVSVFRLLLKGLVFLLPAIRVFGVNLNWVILLMGAAGAYVLKLTHSLDFLTSKLNKQVQELKEGTTALDNYGKTLETLRDKYEQYRKEGKDTAKITLDYFNTLKHLIKANKELGGELEFNVNKMQENIDKVQKLKELKLNETLDKTKESIQTLNKKIEDQVMWTDLWTGARAKLRDTFDTTYIKNYLAEIDKLKEKEPPSWLDTWFKDPLKADFAKMFVQLKKEFNDFKNSLIEAGKLEGPDYKNTQEAVNRMSQDFITIGETLKAQGKTYWEISYALQEMGATVPQIRAVFDKIYEVSKDTRDVKKVEADLSQRLLENSKYRLKFLQMEARLTGDKKKQIEANYEVEFQKLKELQDKRAEELAKKPGVTPEGAKTQAIREVNELRLLLARQRKQKELELEMETQEAVLDLRILTEKKTLEIMKRGATGENARQINLAIRELETEHSKKIVEIRKDFYEKFKALLGAENPKVLELLKEWYSSEVSFAKDSTKELLAHNKERERIEKEHIKYMLETAERTGPEYVAILKRAYELDIINLEDYLDKKTAAIGTLGENLKVGFDQSRRDFQTFNELTQEIGKVFPETFSDDLTGALWDFTDGTKTAKEAMKDFAESTIRWIGEMITKWLIWQAVQAGLSYIGGGGGGGDVTTIRGGEGGGYGFHKGGIVGVTPAPVRIVNPNIFANARRFHGGGLAGDEVPAILQKGETVLPKGGGVTVNVINKSGTDLDAKQDAPRFDGGGLILDVVVDAMNRNKKGFRDNMKGMMR